MTEYCIVTGAGSGIGQATANLIASSGLHVVCCDIDLESVQGVVAKLVVAGLEASAHRLDVSRTDDWQNLVNYLAEREGRVVGLVNNAGIVRDKTLLKMSDDHWSVVLDVNLKGTWLGSKHVIPLMKHGGSIVNLSSESRHGNFGQTNYSAAKAGVVGLTRSIALEQGRNRIRCNAVAPGTVNTAILKDVPDELKDQWKNSIPLRRFADPNEIAEVVWFLISDKSSYVNGHVLDVNGGSS